MRYQKTPEQFLLSDSRAKHLMGYVFKQDNASIHTSEEFADKLPSWKKKGLIIKYLPPYSPELNLIEILWRRIKYTWLPFLASECLNALREALETILSQVGSEYQITFA